MNKTHHLNIVYMTYTWRIEGRVSSWVLAISPGVVFDLVSTICKWVLRILCPETTPLLSSVEKNGQTADLMLHAESVCMVHTNLNNKTVFASGCPPFGFIQFDPCPLKTLSYLGVQSHLLI